MSVPECGIPDAGEQTGSRVGQSGKYTFDENRHLFCIVEGYRTMIRRVKSIIYEYPKVLDGWQCIQIQVDLERTGAIRYVGAILVIYRHTPLT